MLAWYIAWPARTDRRRTHDSCYIRRRGHELHGRLDPRTFDRQSGEWKDGDTLFLRCSIRRQLAENLAESSLGKGTRVIVTGRCGNAPTRSRARSATARTGRRGNRPVPALRHCEDQQSRAQHRPGHTPRRRDGPVDRGHHPDQRRAAAMMMPGLKHIGGELGTRFPADRNDLDPESSKASSQRSTSPTRGHRAVQGHPDRVTQMAYRARLVDTQPMTVASSASDPSDEHRESTTPTTVDAVCGDLTVTFDIRYIDGPAGDRLAAAQAKAIYALLEWMAADQAHQR